MFLTVLAVDIRLMVQCSHVNLMQGCESVGSSKQVCLIDSSLDNILSSFPFCCVVMSLDVIAAMTLETGSPNLLSIWLDHSTPLEALLPQLMNKISYEVKHLIKSYIRKCHQEVHHSVLDDWTSCIIPVWVSSLLKPESLLPLFRTALATGSCWHAWWKPDQRDS